MTAKRTTSSKVAVVTGASRGIGRALALTLGRDGWDVVICYRRDEAAAARVLADVQAVGGGGFTAPVELEQPEAIDALFDLVAERFGSIDGFVSNAAASAFRPVSRLEQHHLDRSFATNTRAFVLAANRAAALMDRGGRIVAVTSYGASRAFPTYAALGAAKAANEAFVRYLAAELGPRGITANAVSGGLIDTDSLEFYYGVDGIPPLSSVTRTIPLQRTGTADEMARAIRFLLSEDASYITGHVLVVDGGLTVVAPPFWPDTTGELHAVFSPD